MTNTVVRFDPFAEFDSLRRQFFGEDWMTPYKGVTLPTTDVYEKENALVVEAHLPNFNEDDVDVHVDNDALIIQAQQHEREEDKDKKFVVRESSTSVYRRIMLPERANTDSIKAHLDDGILKVTVPLTPLPEPKKISISAKSGKK